MKQPIAFADEYGNTSFDFERQSTHFIVASIIVNKHDLGLLEVQAEEIRRKHFQTGEIKSKNVATNYKRRLLILDEIGRMDIQIFAVAVDKRTLYSEGFKHKASFHKFINGLVYKELYRTLPNLTLVVDEHGSNDYMREFKEYVKKNHIRDLFHGSYFDLENSEQNIMIQIADFIAGTIGHHYDENQKKRYANKGFDTSVFLSSIRHQISSINEFPPSYKDLKYYPIEEDEKKVFDENIANLSLRYAIDFIENKQITNPGDSEQISFLKLLLFYQRSYLKQGFVPTKELINHLNAGREPRLTELYFRTSIVGKLRDAGVLVASSSSGDKGYKLPTSVSDIYQFINHSNSIIIPMVNRVRKCRELIKLSTNNDLDILDKPEYSELQQLLDNI
ncbi:Protein of unknown function [Hymenobacter daecheongensis DSM 21074]|uniref:DUF3800 domain-containing protein n=1 Tax=Hymenobacter daecheongensis DSM 21074 TaxID=1121955 RepID=A0A1M6GY36_9BACT|nr:DUF3800 domain-containing protein [Hymenobacter daecheongensis]SHJ14837.1 Protein of unknown function [Hymenobacter daecheongensis DSM 21074]